MSLEDEQGIDAGVEVQCTPCGHWCTAGKCQCTDDDGCECPGCE